MRVLELWRYPVKSLQGERLDRASVTPAGFLGDRRYAIVDVESGLGLTARREPRLLYASAALREDGVDITLPDGAVAKTDSDLSDWLGRAVTLVDAREVDANSYECPIDEDQELQWFTYDGPGMAFHDSGAWRVSLVSKATIGAWDSRRFRANVLLDGEGEDDLVDKDVTLGDAGLHVSSRIPRCVMVTRPQPDGIERELDVLKTINSEREACLAIGAVVTRPGDVTPGDQLRLDGEGAKTRPHRPNRG
jgi:uncharacterized protein YcbX